MPPLGALWRTKTVTYNREGVIFPNYSVFCQVGVEVQLKYIYFLNIDRENGMFKGQFVGNPRQCL